MFRKKNRMKLRNGLIWQSINLTYGLTYRLLSKYRRHHFYPWIVCLYRNKFYLIYNLEKTKLYTNNIFLYLTHNFHINNEENLF